VGGGGCGAPIGVLLIAMSCAAGFGAGDGRGSGCGTEIGPPPTAISWDAVWFEVKENLPAPGRVGGGGCGAPIGMLLTAISCAAGFGAGDGGGSGAPEIGVVPILGAEVVAITCATVWFEVKENAWGTRLAAVPKDKKPSDKRSPMNSGMSIRGFII
jgi:hypothetical protein